VVKAVTTTKAPKMRSPSTVRRQLSQAERDLGLATAAREKLAAQIGATNAHTELAALGEQLAAAQTRVATAEEAWLALAAEAEALGLTP
jgi:hypothetical protein